MGRFVALLRGVNVGPNKRVPMADLRALLADLGHTRVCTLLNSGNAVFDSAGRSTAGHAAQIRQAIAGALAIDVPVIVKSARDLAAIDAENPFASTAVDPTRLFVAFTADAAASHGLRTLEPLVAPPERVHFGAHAVYLWCPEGILQSRAGEALLGRLGKAATTRNWATVTKIMAALNDDAS
jgi:uncharacterized protein (DUF1697 family)